MQPAIHHPTVPKEVLFPLGTMVPGGAHGGLLAALPGAKAALSIRSQAYRSRFPLRQAINNPDREVKTFLCGRALGVVLCLSERGQPRHFGPKIRTIIDAVQARRPALCWQQSVGDHAHNERPNALLRDLRVICIQHDTHRAPIGELHGRLQHAPPPLIPAHKRRGAPPHSRRLRRDAPGFHIAQALA